MQQSIDNVIYEHNMYTGLWQETRKSDILRYPQKHS